MSKLELVLRDGTRIEGTGDIGSMSFPMPKPEESDRQDVVHGVWLTKKLAGAVIVMDGETVYAADNPKALPWITNWTE